MKVTRIITVISRGKDHRVWGLRAVLTGPAKLIEIQLVRPQDANGEAFQAVHVIEGPPGSLADEFLIG